jgi:hypothetical protein
MTPMAVLARWCEADMRLRWTARIVLKTMKTFGKSSVAVATYDRHVFVPKGKGVGIHFPKEDFEVPADAGFATGWSLYSAAPIVVVEIHFMRREQGNPNAQLVRTFDLRAVTDDGSIGASSGALQLSQGIWPVFFVERSQLWRESCNEQR